MLLRALSVPIDDNDSDHLGRDGQEGDSTSEDSRPVEGMGNSMQGNGIRLGNDIHKGSLLL
jgi:hypothetical protein